MQIPPAPILQAYIKHYLFLRTNEVRGMNRLRFFADGNTGIVFSEQLANSAGLLPRTLVYGQLDTFQDLYCTGVTEMMIAVLQPLGLYHLFNLPPAEIGQQGISLSEITGPKADRLWEQVCNANQPREKIRIFEAFILPLINKPLPAELEKALEYIAIEKGQVNITALCTFTGWHERKLERYFATHIGVGPKKYTDLIRIQSFIKQLKKAPNLTAASHAAGYYDQPHLIRTFRKHTGLTPSQYLQANPLASNFLAI
ncbi:AraC family transcriptional regulator [Chitinophaga terrae (ex Kim and Jung 2007)]|nr:helix-turn-helix domain-containing protein [Chitinophaga terrae (ex Kim and Jung 2007)]